MLRENSQDPAFTHSRVVDKQTEDYFPRHENPDKDVVELVFWISFVPYFISIVLPAFSYGPRHGDVSGFFAFLCGGRFVLFPFGPGAWIPFFGLVPGWWANLAYWIAIFVLRRRPSVAIALGLLACLFSLSFLVLPLDPKPEPQIGYFVWCSSFVLFTLGALKAVDSRARQLHGSKSNQGSDNEPTECLSCGETIGAGKAECPKCGWSYRANT